MKTIKLLYLILLFSSCEGFRVQHTSFPLQMQESTVECGPACLKMISDFHGVAYSLETLALLSKMDEHEGTSLGNISEAAKLIGLYNLAVKINYEELLTKAPYPAILHWDDNHFVVIYKMTEAKIWIADPARGYMEYTKEEFLQHWVKKDTIETLEEGYALILETTDSFFHPKTKINAQTQSRSQAKKNDDEIFQSQSEYK